MTSPLRLGFLVSGAFHVAVVAAFSLDVETQVPAVDEPRPLTLQLAMFEPARTVEAQPVPVEPEPPTVAEPEPPAPVMEPEPLEPPPPPVIEQVRPPSPPVQPRKVEKRRVLQQPKRKPPAKPRKASPRPVEPRSVPSPTVELAAAKPRPSVPAFAQEKQHYLAALAANINRKKYYPMGSRRRGEEGTVVVSFVIQRNGELTDLSILKSSGSRRLDAAALKTLKRVTPFRPIPQTLERDRWPITVPIAFRLKG